MAQIALKWDKSILRVAVASNPRAGRVQFDQAIAVQLDDEADDLSPARLGDKLRAILNKVGVQKGDATVVVARGDIEMRQFSLPPVPEEELPDMVRFQSRNHFTAISDDSLIDFVVLNQDEETCTILAATLSPENAQRIRSTVEATGLRLKKIVVRPFAAMQLVRHYHPADGHRIILEIIGREADITVVRNNQVLVTRTARVPDTYTEQQFDAWLPSEIRRTITAARAQANIDQISEIIVCSEASEHQQLSDDLQQSLEIDSRFVQPFAAVQKSSRFEQPARQDGFASLLGSMLSGASQNDGVIDFLNPRKPPEKKIDKQKLFLVGGAVAAVLAIVAFFLWQQVSSRDAEIADLQLKIDSQESILDIAMTRIADSRPLDEWYRRQVNWLEELYRMSELMPDPEQTRLVRFHGSLNRQNAQLDISGLLKNATVNDVTARLDGRPYEEVVPRQTPTNVGDFETGYRFQLDFPLATIEESGEWVPFYHSLPGEEASDVVPSPTGQQGGGE